MNIVSRKLYQWVARSGLLFALMTASVLPGVTLAALLNNTVDFPLISYNNQGVANYNAETDVFSVDATPLAILVAGNPAAVISGPENFIINITVDSSGALTSGVPGDDLVVIGQVTVPGLGFVSGVLLTGEVSGFGFQDSGGSTDNYDFTFTITGGHLAAIYPQTVGISLTSEQSSFTSDFTVNFGGEAKGTLGAIPSTPATLGNRVWEDINSDGIQDSNESGVANIQVNLWDCSGTQLASTLTDADGLYLFDNLPPGDYRIEFILPGGYVFSPQAQGADDSVDSNADTTTGLSACETLLSGEENLSVDAGIYLPATAELGDRFWEDLNANGIQDNGEPGIPGVTVTLQDCQGNVIATDTTDSLGAYLFDGLMAGDYVVKFDLPSGYSYSPQDAGADDARDSDANPFTGETSCTTLGANESNRSLDGAAYQAAALGDFIWEDTNRNGIQDGEPGIAGVTVELSTCDGNVLDSTITDGNGNYRFEGLMPGGYMLRIIAPFGMVFSPQNQGADAAVDSDADATGKTACVVLTSGETNLTVDAGLNVPANPGVRIEKATNGVDADNANGGDAPQIKPGEPVTWTYVVTNIGNVMLQSVMVIDDQGVAVDCPQSTLAVNDFMTCTANGVAEDLSATSYTTVQGVCGNLPDKPLYKNRGTAKAMTADGVMVQDNDPSHYCNPPSGTCNLIIHKSADPDTIMECSCDDHRTDYYSSYTLKSGYEYKSDSDSDSDSESDKDDRCTCKDDDDRDNHDDSDEHDRSDRDSDGDRDSHDGDRYDSKTYSTYSGGEESSCPAANQAVYTYTVNNAGDPLESVKLMDDKLGKLRFPNMLSTGQTVTISKAACITESTTNTATVSGTLPDGGLCEASDSADVIVMPAPPSDCTDSGDHKDADRDKDHESDEHDSYRKSSESTDSDEHTCSGRDEDKESDEHHSDWESDDKSDSKHYSDSDSDGDKYSKKRRSDRKSRYKSDAKYYSRSDNDWHKGSYNRKSSNGYVSGKYSSRGDKDSN